MGAVDSEIFFGSNLPRVMQQPACPGSVGRARNPN